MTFRIAISQRVVENSAYPERRDALDVRWSPFIRGILPGAVLLPVPNDPAAILDWLEACGVDGVILSGGNSLFESPERDATEKILLEHAVKRQLPVFGVCRGLHAINHFLSGDLPPARFSDSGGHVAVRHDCRISGPRFLDMAGTETIVCNSFHDEYLTPAMLAGGLRCFAMGEGGVVEGFHHVQWPVLAVQWHPERGDSSGLDKALISKLFTEGAFWMGEADD